MMPPVVVNGNSIDAIPWGGRLRDGASIEEVRMGKR